MDYSKLSDEQITNLIGISLGWKSYYRHKDGSISFRDKKGLTQGKKNYCNNPADAWPIIERYEIGLVKTPHGWCASQDQVEFEGVYFVDEKPLRAAMIVYLMMQEGNDGGTK